MEQDMGNGILMQKMPRIGNGKECNETLMDI